MIRYLIRLDDACPTMDSSKWHRIEEIMDKYGIRPMVGIVPRNEDPDLQIDKEDENFWDKARRWEMKGWSIALHGFNHCCISQDGGINPFWKRSEFAGMPIEVQKQKIRDGIAIFHLHSLNPKYFFAPSHTFDLHTLVALRECSDIRIISDTIAIKPYKANGFVFIPQIMGHCEAIKISGIWTFCLHPNIMSEIEFCNVDNFLNKYFRKCIGFDELNLEFVRNKSIASRFLSYAYFTQRKIRNLQ